MSLGQVLPSCLTTAWAHSFSRSVTEAKAATVPPERRDEDTNAEPSRAIQTLQKKTWLDVES